MDSAIVLRKCKSKAIRNAKISYLHPLMYLFLSQKNNELSEMVHIYNNLRTDARGHKSKHFVCKLQEDRMGAEMKYLS